LATASAQVCVPLGHSSLYFVLLPPVLPHPACQMQMEDNAIVLILILKAHLQISDDVRKSAFLFQHLSVLIQRFNSVAVHDTFAHKDDF